MSTLPMNYLYAVRKGSNVCKDRDYHIMSLDGRNLYTDETKEDYIAQGLEILDATQFNELWEQCEKDYEDELCGKWKEISEERYEEQLNVLPPLKWTNGGFFMSEFYSGKITSFYQEWGCKFYSSMQNAFRNRNEIIEELKNNIALGLIEPIKAEV
jgi:hypothetical protein